MRSDTKRYTDPIIGPYIQLALLPYTHTLYNENFTTNVIPIFSYVYFNMGLKKT